MAAIRAYYAQRWNLYDVRDLFAHHNCQFYNEKPFLFYIKYNLM